MKWDIVPEWSITRRGFGKLQFTRFFGFIRGLKFKLRNTVLLLGVFNIPLLNVRFIPWDFVYTRIGSFLISSHELSVLQGMLCSPSKLSCSRLLTLSLGKNCSECSYWSRANDEIPFASRIWPVFNRLLLIGETTVDLGDSILDSVTNVGETALVGLS